ncbi:MAG: hypothetical protein MUE88_08990 [Flavobacteriales bacterium]|jgi:hypothetical protein|nr:hypothetical protein [Flavobacteriales bacterium]
MDPLLNKLNYKDQDLVVVLNAPHVSAGLGVNTERPFTYYLWSMATSALHRKMMAEFLDKIKDWPEDALRSLKEAIDRRITSDQNKKSAKPQGGTMDAFGAWVGPESAEEIIAMIEGSRTMGSEREPLD